MPFAAALSTNPESTRALEDVCGQALARLQGTPDLALLFFSPHHAAAAPRFAATAQKRLGARCLFGCPGESIIGNDQEVEQDPALSLWLGRWNAAVTLSPFHLVLEETPDGHSLLGWPDALAAADPARSLVLAVADPYTFPVDAFLAQVNDQHRGLRVLGAMASGTRGPGDCP